MTSLLSPDEGAADAGPGTPALMDGALHHCGNRSERWTSMIEEPDDGRQVSPQPTALVDENCPDAAPASTACTR